MPQPNFDEEGIAVSSSDGKHGGVGLGAHLPKQFVASHDDEADFEFVDIDSSVTDAVDLLRSLITEGRESTALKVYLA